MPIPTHICRISGSCYMHVHDVPREPSEIQAWLGDQGVRLTDAVTPSFNELLPSDSSVVKLGIMLIEKLNG